MKRDLRLVFDLDDTLYPERAFALSGFRAAGAWAHEHWGVREDIWEQMGGWLDGGHLGQVFKMALDEHRPGYTDDELAQFVDVYRRHEPELELFEDAEAALELWAARGPIGLITDGTWWVQQNKVKALGVGPRFAHIIYTNALGGRAFHKPHPRSFELMEQELDVPDPKSRARPRPTYVYVGDNPAKDFAAPNERGWVTVQVYRRDGIHDTTPTSGPGAAKHVIAHLGELDRVLTKSGVLTESRAGS